MRFIICGQRRETVNSRNVSSEIRSGWYAQPFSPRNFEMYFHVQITPSCKSERLVVFFWCGQDQKGPGGAGMYSGVYIKRFGETRVRRCAPGVVYS